VATSLDFLGKSLRYPVRTGIDGDLEIAEGIDNIRSSFRYFLAVISGNLPMTDFGNISANVLFENIDDISLDIFTEDLRVAAAAFFPRIIIHSVKQVTDGRNQGNVRYKILYGIKNTDILDSEIVLPPGEV